MAICIDFGLVGMLIERCDCELLGGAQNRVSYSPPTANLDTASNSYEATGRTPCISKLKSAAEARPDASGLTLIAMIGPWFANLADARRLLGAFELKKRCAIAHTPMLFPPGRGR
jgi:hypothetical protein